MSSAVRTARGLFALALLAGTALIGTAPERAAAAPERAAASPNHAAASPERAAASSARVATVGGSAGSASAAAGFLQARLAAGGHKLVNTQFKSTDYGLTIDAVLALDAAGTGASEADATTALVEREVGQYTGAASGDLYAGALGKALAFASAQGRKPTSFGGHDLVAQLRSLEQASGRFSDKSAYGDNSNVIGQSWAVIGLVRAGSQPIAKPAGFIAEAQCPDGGFPTAFGGASCVSAPDATAFAAQALIAARTDPDAVKQALDYLVKAQASDGSFGGGETTKEPNTNSTSVAAQALAAGGRTAEAERASAYVARFQLGCTAAEPMRGAIVYNGQALAAGEKPDAAPTDEDVRATTQGVLGLTRIPLADISAEGAEPVAPTLDCTATPTASAQSDDSSPAPATGAAGATEQTGSGLGTGALVGAAIVLIGAGTVIVIRRRRGEHR